MKQTMKISFQLLFSMVITVVLIRNACATMSRDGYENMDLTSDLYQALKSAKALTFFLQRFLASLSNGAPEEYDYPATNGKKTSLLVKREDPLGLGGRFGRR